MGQDGAKMEPHWRFGGLRGALERLWEAWRRLWEPLGMLWGALGKRLIGKKKEERRKTTEGREKKGEGRQTKGEKAKKDIYTNSRSTAFGGPILYNI